MLSHAVSPKKPKSWWWIWGEPGHQWPQSPCWGTTWTLLNITHIWGCSSTINWTGLSTLKSFTRRTRAASVCGSAPFNICRTMQRRFYESVVCWGIRLRVATGSTSWSGRPVTLWGWSWTLWQQCQSGGCCRSCGRYCSTALTLSTTLWSNRLIAPKCTTERHRKSFLPVAMKLYNSSLWWSDSNDYLYKKKKKL